MIAWQQILCALTFAAGIIDTVAIYKFYAPQIFLYSEGPRGSNLIPRNNLPDDVSIQQKKAGSPSLSSPLKLEPSEIAHLGDSGSLDKRRNNKILNKTTVTNPDLTFLDSEDLVKDSEQADIISKSNEITPPTTKTQRSTIITKSSPSKNIPIFDGPLQPANTLDVDSDPNRSPDETPAFVFHFRKNVAELNWRDENQLRQHVHSLRDNDLITIRLVGFADPSGPKTYNYYLGLKRARNVARFLSKRGVPRSRIQIISSGEIDDTFGASRSSIQDMNQRRRVEVYFTEKDEATDE